MRVRRDRRDLRRQIGPRRMADQGKSSRVGPDMPDAVMKDPEGIANRRQRVGQEILGHRAHVVLVAREDDDPAVANEVIDPGPIKPGIDGEPAMEKHHHGRFPLGLGLFGLKDKVRSGPLADLEPLDPVMAGVRLGLASTETGRAAGRIVGRVTRRRRRPGSPARTRRRSTRSRRRQIDGMVCAASPDQPSTSMFEAASRSGKLAQFAYLARNVKADTLATVGHAASANIDNARLPHNLTGSCC